MQFPSPEAVLVPTPPNRLTVTPGNLLDASEPILGHQVNCTTTGIAKGLARAVFERFPDADVYQHRSKPSVPGTATLHPTGQPGRYILNLYGQFYPGAARYNNDTEELREKWLRLALTDFLTKHKPGSLALPWGIGCGLAGGHWPLYQKLLQGVANLTETNIVLYRRD